MILFAFFSNESEISCCSVPSHYNKLLSIISLQRNARPPVTVFRLIN